MDAGVEVFSKVGYDAATTKLVAKHAGLNESLIQRYFESKAGLLLAIISTFAETQEQCSKEYPPGQTVEQEIENFFESRLDDYAEKHDFIRVVISRAIVDPKISSVMSGHTYKGGLAAIRTRLEEFRKKGKIRRDSNLEHVGLSLCGQAFMLGFMAQNVFGMERAALDEIAREMARTVARGLTP